MASPREDNYIGTMIRNFISSFIRSNGAGGTPSTNHFIQQNGSNFVQQNGSSVFLEN